MIADDIEWKDGVVELRRRTLTGGLIGLYVIALILAGARPFVPIIIAVPVIVVALSFVPGTLFLLSISDERQFGAKWVVYALGTSLMLLMLLGLLMNLLLPVVGVDRPLATVPLAISISLLVGALALASEVSGGYTYIKVKIGNPVTPVPLSLALVPFLSLYGVTFLNRTAQNELLLIALIAIAFLPLVVLFWVRAEWHSFAIWTMALGVLYHDALFVGKAFPGNPVVVLIWKAGRWVPGTNTGGPLSSELLQHGTIFPMFAIVNDLFILDQMVLVNPFFVSFIPVALFVTYREYIDTRLAFLAASVFIFAHPFYKQYPTAGRSATPVLFLALFAVTMSESGMRRSVRAGLALLFLSGVIFTHYGTSYFFMSAILVSSAVYVSIRYLDRILRWTRMPEFRRWSLSNFDIVQSRSAGLLTWPLRGFYVTLTFAWFLFTNDARAFALFPRHFSRVIEQFVGGDIGAGAGRTGARLQRDYGSVAIETSKLFYEILGLLMIVGIIVSLYYRFYRANEYRFDDHFFVMGLVMLGLFGLTIIARTWGGGRPMMITFVFTLVFVGVAVGWLFEQTAHLRQRLTILWNRSYDSSVLLSVFSVFLAVLFVLNSGVASALILPGSAPSTVPLSDPEDNIATDAAAHAWLIDYSVAGPIYGDNVAFGQSDWLAAYIVARTENGTGYAGNKPGEVERLNRPGVEHGYLIFLDHNLKSGELQLYLETNSINRIQSGYRENRVYTTKFSEIYYIS